MADGGYSALMPDLTPPCYGVTTVGAVSQSVSRKPHSLDIGTLVTHRLLGHLEAARPELRGPHLLPAVALPLPRSFFGDGLVPHDLPERAGPQASGRGRGSLPPQKLPLTSTKFPEYTSSRVTSRSRMMSFPLGMFRSCCCRFPPNMKPKSPKKLWAGHKKHM